MATSRSTAVARTAQPRDRTKTGPTPRQPRKAPFAGEVITYNGVDYRMADKIGVWPLMQLARAAQEGVNSTDLRGLAALHAMFQDILHPDDWPQFEADMIATKMDDPMALLQTTQDAVVRIQARQAKLRAVPAEGEVVS